MQGKKYLSDLVDISTLYTDKLNVIEAPTGSGKSYFALHHIPSLVNDPYHKIIYLIDTCNGKKQIIDNYENASPEYWGWFHDVFGLNFTENENVVVMTYAKFGVFCSNDPTFPDCFEYIICDELPSLIDFQDFSAKPNVHSIAKQFLERAVKNNKTKVIALTATPQNLNNFYAEKFVVPIDTKELIQYETIERIPYGNLENILADVDKDEIGLCYIASIHQMKIVEEKAKELGLKPICIWSIRNEDHKMTEDQLSVRESILKNFTLPEPYNFLIINKSCETSIKIKSHVDYVIVHSTNKDTQIQVRGRVNSDLKKLYLHYEKIETRSFPDKYLGVKLFTEDKNELCKTLGLRNKNGRPKKWPSVQLDLLELGFTITEGRCGNIRYVIITKE